MRRSCFGMAGGQGCCNVLRGTGWLRRCREERHLNRGRQHISGAGLLIQWLEVQFFSPAMLSLDSRALGILGKDCAVLHGEVIYSLEK